MFNFKESAMASTLLSSLQSNRTKISTDELVAQYPNGVTVNAFDFATVQDKTFAVVTFAEDDTKYYNGGTVLTKMCLNWAAGFDGDPESASVALAKSGGVKLKFALAKTKSGNNVTTVTVV